MIPLTDLKLNKFQSGLYIVATPIGNLSDITIRALEVLKISDYVLCEDTRVSRKLLDKFKIKANLISNHKFNEKKILNKIINLLEEGKIISLISDAGTPCISDPGGIIVRECIKKDIQMTIKRNYHGCLRPRFVIRKRQMYDVFSIFYFFLEITISRPT